MRQHCRGTWPRRVTLRGGKGVNGRRVVNTCCVQRGKEAVPERPFYGISLSFDCLIEGQRNSDRRLVQSSRGSFCPSHARTRWSRGLSSYNRDPDWADPRCSTLTFVWCNNFRVSDMRTLSPTPVRMYFLFRGGAKSKNVMWYRSPKKSCDTGLKNHWFLSSLLFPIAFASFFIEIFYVNFQCTCKADKFVGA